MEYLSIGIISYLMGSIPFGFLLTKYLIKIVIPIIPDIILGESTNGKTNKDENAIKCKIPNFTNILPNTKYENILIKIVILNLY